VTYDANMFPDKKGEDLRKQVCDEVDNGENHGESGVGGIVCFGWTAQGNFAIHFLDGDNDLDGFGRNTSDLQGYFLKLQHGIDLSPFLVLPKSWLSPPGTSSAEMLELEMSEGAVGDEGKAEGQLKPNIPSVHWIADQFADGTDKPDLSHAHHGPENAETEGAEGGQRGREFVGLVIVLGERDAFVDGQPVALVPCQQKSPTRRGRGGFLTIINMKFSRTDAKCEYPGMATAT